MTDSPDVPVADSPEQDAALQSVGPATDAAPQDAVATASAADPATTAVPDPDAPIANVRRAPRLGRFIVAGAIVGIVVGVIVSLVAGLILDQRTNMGFVSAMTALAGLTVGGLTGAYLAVRADRNSTPAP